MSPHLSLRGRGWALSVALHAAFLAVGLYAVSAEREPPPVFRWAVAMAPSPTTEAAPAPAATPPRPKKPRKSPPRQTAKATEALQPRPTPQPLAETPPVEPEIAPESVASAQPTPPAAASPPDANAIAAEIEDDLLRRIHALKRYPNLALRNGWEGRVTIRAVLAADGRLLEAEIQQSSGYAALDRDAIALVRRAAEQGQRPVEPRQVAVLIPITYRIER